MGKLLIKLFVKDHQDVKNPKVRESYGKLAGIIGVLSNLLLCIMKIAIGLIASSIAIIADGINNLTDASSSVITLIGFKLSALPEDEDHPYGHARIEYLTWLFISILIIILGLMLLRSSVIKILHPDPLFFSYTTVVILVIAIVVKMWQAAFNKYIGKLINSVALAATAADSRNDVISTCAVLLGIIIGRLTGIQLDGYMGCLVALFIVWSGIQLIRETSSPLLGEAPDEDLVNSISELTTHHEGVLGIHDLVVHNYGPGKIFASIHIEVDADGDLMESHDMIDNVEREISETLSIHFVAHMDPVKTNDPLVEKLRGIIMESIENLEGVRSMHDLRIVPGPTHTNIIFDLVLAVNCRLKESEIRDIVQNKLRESDPKYCVVITFDHAYTKLDN